MRRHAGAGPLADYEIGQRVNTREGFPGVITDIHEGPSDLTTYWVTLDGGQGGGEYAEAEIWPEGKSTAASILSSVEHTAMDDYPELGTILSDRLPPTTAAGDPDAFRSMDVECDNCGSMFTRDQILDGGACPECGEVGQWSQVDKRASLDGAAQHLALYLPMVPPSERASPSQSLTPEEKVGYTEGFSQGQEGITRSPSRPLESDFMAGFDLGWAEGVLAFRQPPNAWEARDLDNEQIGGMVPSRLPYDPTSLGSKQAVTETSCTKCGATLGDYYDDGTNPEADGSIGCPEGGSHTPAKTAGWFDDITTNPGNLPSVDWCRFRKDSHCFLPKDLDEAASAEAGYAVWIPFDRGHCPRQRWTEQEECPAGQPGPRASGPVRYTDATVPWSAGGQRGGLVDPADPVGTSTPHPDEFDPVHPKVASVDLGMPQVREATLKSSMHAIPTPPEYNREFPGSRLYLWKSWTASRDFPHLLLNNGQAGDMILLAKRSTIPESLKSSIATIAETWMPQAGIVREYAMTPTGTDFYSDQADDLSRAYRDMAIDDPTANALWAELGALCVDQAEGLKGRYEIIRLDDRDPYATAEEMYADIDRGVYKVTSLHSHHPVWDVDTNVAFRIVHDLTGHTLSHSDFSFRGEVIAYQNQCASTPAHLWPVLFTEIVAQSAYVNVHHLFGEQKVGLIGLTQAQIDAHVGLVMDAPDALYDPLHTSASRTVRDHGSIKDLFTDGVHTGSLVAAADGSWIERDTKGDTIRTVASQAACPICGDVMLSQILGMSCLMCGTLIPYCSTDTLYVISDDGLLAQQRAKFERTAVASERPEYVQDQSTNNIHVRGDDKEDGTPTALCNKRYRVFTYDGDDAQQSFHEQFSTWGKCPSCDKKHQARTGSLQRTATWRDVQAKAKRIRSEGGVRLVADQGGTTVAHVHGDHGVYETEIVRVPGKSTVGSWNCGCKWASYSWGRSGPWKIFEGRMCSHALAVTYETQSRGMFGKPVELDSKQPAWMDQKHVHRPGDFDRTKHVYTSLQVQARKDTDPPEVSGVAVQATDTGRVLMIQRSMDDDTAAGTWEFPGGHHEDGDLTSLHAAIREWEEEIGQHFPEGGHVEHTWRSPNGVYQGHLVVIPKESDVVLHEGRTVDNPDDPDKKMCEQAAWWTPEHAQKNPAIRPETKTSTPWPKIKAAASKTSSLTKTADDDQCPYCAGDSLVEGGKYVCEEGHRWHPDDPAAQRYHGDGPERGVIQPKEGRTMDMNPDEFGSMFDDVPLGTTAEMHDEPEPALPYTDGTQEDEAMATQAALRLAAALNVGQATYPTPPASWNAATPPIDMQAAIAMQRAPYEAPAPQMDGKTALAYAEAIARGETPPGPNPFSWAEAETDNETASAAQQFLATTALKTYTAPEREEIIAEGETDKVGASNTDRMDIKGTHYESMLSATAASGDVPEDEDLWMLGGDPNDDGLG